MASQNYCWPSSSEVTVDIAAQGVNGDVAPSESLQVGGVNPDGDLEPISIAADGSLEVSVVNAIPLPAGAATEAKQDAQIVLETAGNASLAAINTKTPALSSGRVPVDVQASVLPTGAATETTLSAVNGKFGSLGQKAMTGSAPVVIASDQSSIPVTVASLPIPSGAATLAEQQAQTALLGTIDTSNSSINTKTPALGQALMAASSPVVIASNQSAVPISGTVTANLGTIAGVATETTLAAMSAKLPATLGQKVMTASMAVVLASDQSSVPVAATPVVPPALTVKSAGITVGTSAVRLTTDGSAPSSTRRVLVANCDSANASKFYIGPSGVTASTGVLLVAGQTFAADNDAGDYYVICNTAAQTLFVLEQE